jgi:metallo-beta-lactamase class B
MRSLRKTLPILLFIVSLSLISFGTIAQKIKPQPTKPEWVKDYQPFRIVGNLYYVGTYDLACYLITTSQGDILINTGVAGSEPMIRAHVEQLGFKFNDIKILLATHAHFDHVGAMADVKKVTGAVMMINEKDAKALADGGNSDYLYGGKGSLFAPVKADVLLHDRSVVKLGNMQITVLNHPGHTNGASSFLFDVKDKQRTYRVLIANMPSVLDETKFPGMATYTNVGKDYAYTFNAMKNLKFDIWLASHASQFGLHTKHKPGDAYNPAIFIDHKGYEAALSKLDSVYLKRMNKK